MTRAALAALAAALLAAAAAYASAFLPGGAPGWAGPTLAVASVGAMVAVALLGVGRRGWSPLVAGLVAGGALLAWALAVTWLMPALEGASPALAWGLPFRAAHLLYGVGLVPALAVPLLYALTFDRETLGEEALRRFREEAARMREEARTDGPAGRRAGAPAEDDRGRGPGTPA